MKLIVWFRNGSVDECQIKPVTDIVANVDDGDDDDGDGNGDGEDGNGGDGDDACAVLTLLTGPTQRLLLTPDSSCVEPILDQFELTADRDNDDHEDVGNFQKNDKDGELVQLQIQPRCYQIIVMMVLMMIRKMNIMIPINILG